ncbi:hypothetical protein [Gorillibacterium massiliense]|uniref:hypothetical protein n=1 Tax=Gorillibacterium massiliense TaxID=1280390 RepID=UPI000593659A|nr:hypothetical protein [Gorillibacterium massiliense]
MSQQKINEMNHKAIDFSIQSSVITINDYEGLIIESNIIERSFMEALQLAVDLIKAESVYSVEIVSTERQSLFSFEKDYMNGIGKEILLHDNELYKWQDYFSREELKQKLAVIRINVFMFPSKHFDTLLNTDHLTFEGFISFLDENPSPLIKPIPGFKNGPITVQDWLELINNDQIDYRINELHLEQYDIHDYFELEGIVDREEIIDLSQSVEHDLSRLTAVSYIEPESNDDFEMVVSSEFTTTEIAWKWSYDDLYYREMRSPFEIDERYFVGCVKLTLNDLKKIADFKTAEEVIRYLKK